MFGRANHLRKKEGAIYSLAINVAVGAENADRIFRFKLEPDNPVEGQRLVFLSWWPENRIFRLPGNFRLEISGQPLRNEMPGP